jgi:hypothetical protein
MDFTRWTVLMFCVGALCLMLLAGCTYTVTNDEGETDAEIKVMPTEESIQNSINSGEIEPGVNIGISVPISLTEEN